MPSKPTALDSPASSPLPSEDKVAWKPEDAVETESPPPRKQLIPSIEGFRGYATLAVLITHVFVWSGMPKLGFDEVTNTVAGGVLDYFFVISGFVLFLPAMRNNGSLGSLRSYGIRRAGRIAPLFYVSLVVVALTVRWSLPGFGVDLPFQSAAGNMSLVMHILFLHNFMFVQDLVPIAFQPVGFGNPAVWTLPLEVVFYCLLPLVALKFYKHPFVMLFLAIGAGELWRLGTSNLQQVAGWLGQDPMSPDRLQLWQAALTHTPTFFGQFAFGMTGAWVFHRLGATPDHKLRRWAPAVMLIATVFALREVIAQGALRLAEGPNQPTTKTPELAFWFTVLMVATLVAPAWAQRPFSNRLIRRMGTYSYGIYLFHLPLLYFALNTLSFGYGDSGDFFRLLPFVLVTSTAMGWISYELVEKPVRRWVVKKTRQPKPLPVPDDAVP